MPFATPIAAASIALLLLGDPTPPAKPGEISAKPTEPLATPKSDTEGRRPEVPQAEGLGATRTPEIVKRVGGDREISIEIRDGAYVCGPSTIEAPLPDGYPEPTPPGAIDIKEYPSVRRAEFRQESARGLSTRMNMGFWPLFNHISHNEIPMTSPVEIEFDGVFSDLTTLKPVPDGAWTMSFLYRAKDLGPTGDAGPVKVVDTASVTVLSVGVRGPYGMDVAREGIKLLKPWIEGQDEWEIADEPRIFHYNGPSIRDVNKWSEIQIPVRQRAKDAGPAGPAAAPPVAAPAGSAQSTAPASR